MHSSAVLVEVRHMLMYSCVVCAIFMSGGSSAGGSSACASGTRRIGRQSRRNWAARLMRLNNAMLMRGLTEPFMAMNTPRWQVCTFMAIGRRPRIMFVSATGFMPCSCPYRAMNAPNQSLRASSFTASSFTASSFTASSSSYIQANTVNNRSAASRSYCLLGSDVSAARCSCTTAAPNSLYRSNTCA